MALAFSVGGLDGNLPQIFSFLQNWGIPSALSDLTLVLFSLLSTIEFRMKNGFPDQEAQRASQEGKELIPKNEMIMRVRRMTIEQGMRAGLSRFPDFHKTGSVRGMRKLYYGSKCLLVRCGDYIYNVSSEQHIYYQITF